MATVWHFLFCSVKITHKSVKGKHQQVSATSFTQALPAPFCSEFSNSNTFYLNDCDKKINQNKNIKPPTPQKQFYFVCALKSLSLRSLKYDIEQNFSVYYIKIKAF